MMWLGRAFGILVALASYSASLTTINTPHRGCAFVEWLLEKMPPCICNWLAARYDHVMKCLGDTDHNLYAAVCELDDIMDRKVIE